jgi:hypothetical protein
MSTDGPLLAMNIEQAIDVTRSWNAAFGQTQRSEGDGRRR